MTMQAEIIILKQEKVNRVDKKNVESNGGG